MEQTQNMNTAKPKLTELRERAVRLAIYHCEGYQSEAVPLMAIAGTEVSLAVPGRTTDP